MPSLGSHLVRARIVAQRLALSEIDRDRGSFYLGATAPDIRVLTRLDREVTHFFRLADLGEQDSVERMFREHPELATPAGLETATSAFIAGYLTHLVLDQSFIGEIYRPSFGQWSAISDDPRSNILDRALQYEMDRLDREDEPVMAEIQQTLAAAVPVRGIPFIEDKFLEEWVTVTESVAGQPADYSRFRRMMVRHIEAAGYDADAVERECADPEALIREAFGIVTPERVQRFWRDAEDQMTERVRTYLK
ncbi:MAG: hypothetical protein DWG83_00425 [Chloroflexi bacterium]|nr:zinc dependent phospholipase C family protein [Chloroflexota bacterium]MDA1239902.1 zinc dependent phospholipase C family protein [Chloroflexota bacterium]MQC19024.1 hypothetical protein [Chloroflexota bacterium]